MNNPMERNIEYQRFQQDCPYTPHAPKGGAGLFASLFVATAMLWMVVFNSPAAAALQEEELIDLLTRMESSYAKVEDFSAVFRKHERVKDVLLPEDSVNLKFKKPLQIYMKWIEDRNKEAIYVQGSNGNKVIAHKGISPTWNLDPNGFILTADNRHSITDIGFGFILNVMRTNIPKAIEHAEIEIIRIEDESFEGRSATVVEAKFTPNGGRRYYAARMVCHVDKEHLLPVGIACYDEKDVLLEEYCYKDVKINVGLTDMDFSRKNPGYNF